MTRIEHDSMGDIEISSDVLWGAQTERSRRLFKIGEEIMPHSLTRAMIMIKRVAASVNEKLGCVDPIITRAIIAAADELLSESEKFQCQFPLKVWQTGSGTQSHMNVNEVIANLANLRLGSELGSKSPVHPNDHVNFGQSSNDSFPTAMHIAATLVCQDHLIPSLTHLWKALDQKAKEFANVLKIARTHLQDATPMTAGQEFSAFARQIELSIERVHLCLDGVCALAQGGTAVGTGLNTHKDFAAQFAVELNNYFKNKYNFRTSSNKFEALSTHDAIVQLSGALNTIAVSFMKIGNDIRLLGSGPRAGLNELLLPENEPGSSIMPGKVNPTQAEALTMVAAQVMGNHTTITIAGSQGHMQLNVFKPVIAYNILQSIGLLGDAAKSFAVNCVEGIALNAVQLSHNVEHSLMVATALNTVIGYDKAAKAAKKANKEGISLKEAALELGFLTEKDYDKHVKPGKMINPFESINT
ncbi:MAG: class II fumarate hydratase [Alphaproteobacteria bacterium]|nr:class II fumarate hydratase [Alphaproteobacteria bacterium]MBX9977460.1 class II fumarate hydratase [Alphaproteobacteria bacterium]